MFSIHQIVEGAADLLRMGGDVLGPHYALCRKYRECRKVPKVASSACSETKRRQVRRPPMEVGGVLEGLAQPQHVALGEGLADDLHTDRQAARLAGRHGETAQAEIIRRPRQEA